MTEQQKDKLIEALNRVSGQLDELIALQKRPPFKIEIITHGAGGGKGGETESTDRQVYTFNSPTLGTLGPGGYVGGGGGNPNGQTGLTTGGPS